MYIVRVATQINATLAEVQPSLDVVGDLMTRDAIPGAQVSYNVRHTNDHDAEASMLIVTLMFFVASLTNLSCSRVVCH